MRASTIVIAAALTCAGGAFAQQGNDANRGPEKMSAPGAEQQVAPGQGQSRDANRDAEKMSPSDGQQRSAGASQNYDANRDAEKMSQSGKKDEDRSAASRRSSQSYDANRDSEKMSQPGQGASTEDKVKGAMQRLGEKTREAATWIGDRTRRTFERTEQTGSDTRAMGAGGSKDADRSSREPKGDSYSSSRQQGDQR